MKMFKVIMITFVFCFGFYLHSDVMQAHESVEIEEVRSNKDKTRGASDYYYTPIDYNITRISNKYYKGTKTFTFRGGLDFDFKVVKLHLELHGSGTYKVYSYTANITLIAKKTDAMGHNLGNVTFKNNGVTMYEYIAV